VARVVAVAAVGIAHELGDGDFTKAAGGPWNGVIDVLAFLPVPLVWWFCDVATGRFLGSGPLFVERTRRIVGRDALTLEGRRLIVATNALWARAGP